MAARSSILVTLAVAGAALASATSAYGVDLRRCEDNSGHITYSNEPCPTGTTRERGVENRPAVEIPPEKTPDKSADKAPRTAKTGAIVPSASAPETPSPERSQEVAREQKKSLIARCDDLVRRIEYSQQDLLAAAPGERASVELGLRRLQEEHEANCVTH